MSKELTTGTQLSAQDASDLSALLNQHAKASETTRAYKHTLAEFDNWLRESGYAPDEQGIGAYLHALDKAGAKTATIRRKLSALRFFHNAAHAKGVKAVMSAIVRKRASALTDTSIEGTRGNKSKSKSQVTLEQLRAMCAQAPEGITETRNRAILLVGFWLAARRSELVALNVDDIEWTKDGALVQIVRSKTDQSGEGGTKPLVSLANGEREIDPCTALRQWLSASDITKGAVFVGTTPQGKLTRARKRITPQVVALVVKSYCAKAGLDASAFAGHSLRSGFVTAARQLRIPDATIKAVTGHKTDKMLDHYDKRDARDALKVIRRAVLNAPRGDDD
jgi:site-specific recombinase XerD